MPVAGGGFEQSYNAQAAVATGRLLVVGVNVVEAANDKQQVTPMLNILKAQVNQLGQPDTMVTDNGVYSAINVNACHEAGIAPLPSMGREHHHRFRRERFATPPPAPVNPTPLEAMAYRLATPEGRQCYALRKHTPEPVFGIIKSVMCFRQFLLRGLEKVKGEWRLVTMAWDVRRMFALRGV